MKSNILGVTLALLLATPVYAEPASDESLRTLRKVMKMDSQFDAILSKVQQSIRAQLQGSLKNPELSAKQQAQLEVLLQNTLQKYQNQLLKDTALRDKILTEWNRAAQKHYTQEEVNGMIAFYLSPVGQSVLEKQPLVVGDYMTAISPIISDYNQTHTQKMWQELESDFRKIMRDKAH